MPDARAPRTRDALRPVRRLADAPRWVIAGSRVVIGGVVTIYGMSRAGGLREAMRPWKRFDRVEQIPFEELPSQGVRAVLFDLENTLIPPGGPFTDEGRSVVERVRGAGMQVGVVTNCSAAWARRALDDEAIEYSAPAHKPAKEAFVTVAERLGHAPGETVFVGDQVITDVFGAQRAGMRAILLEPRWPSEALSSRFQRVVSSVLLRVAGDSRRG